MAQRHIKNGLEAVLDIDNVTGSGHATTVWVDESDAADLIRQVNKLSSGEDIDYLTASHTVGAYIR